MDALIAILLLTGRVLLGFILFVTALAITTTVFATFWFRAKYLCQLRYKMALEDYRSKRSEERWAKRTHKEREDDDD